MASINRELDPTPVTLPEFLLALKSRGLAVASQGLPLDLGDDGKVPEWVKILPAGTFKGVDGRGPWQAKDPNAIAAASMATNDGNGFCVDYNHQSVFAVVNGGQSPAAGWVDKAEARDGAIWAHVAWTEDGAKAVASKHYRFVSPTFTHDKAGNVQSVISVGLVNAPNIAELPAINATLGNTALGNTALGATMDELLQALRQALGLPADADQGSIIAACQRAASGVATMAQFAATDLGLAANAGVPDIVSAARAKFAGNPDPAQFAPMAMVLELQTKLAQLQTNATTSAAAEAIKDAKAAGKISPAMEAWATEFATSNLDGFKQYVSVASVIVSPTAVVTGAPPEGSSKTEDEISREVCARLGITPEAFAKANKEAA